MDVQMGMEMEVEVEVVAVLEELGLSTRSPEWVVRLVRYE